MGRYDSATEEFISKVASQHFPKPPAHADEKKHEPVKDSLKAVKTVVRTLENPGEQLSRRAITEVASSLMKMAATSPLKIYDLLNDHYRRDWWDWEPETIWRTLELDHDLEAEDEVKNLVMAFQIIVSSNAPFEHWHIFEKIGHALCNDPVDFNVLQPLGLPEAAFTIQVLEKMRPQQAFDDDVMGYVAASAKQSGVVFLPPKWFRTAQSFLDKLNNDLELAEETKTRWAGTETIKDGDSPALRIQLLGLREIDDFVREHA